jgi:hypothetical protein
MSNLYISKTWPNLWTSDATNRFTFDSTDTQYTFDGGQVRCGGKATQGDKQPKSAKDTLSVTQTENLLF